MRRSIYQVTPDRRKVSVQTTNDFNSTASNRNLWKKRCPRMMGCDAAVYQVTLRYRRNVSVQTTNAFISAALSRNRWPRMVGCDAANANNHAYSVETKNYFISAAPNRNLWEKFCPRVVDCDASCMLIDRNLLEFR